jgi:hypothetical protein
MFLGLGKKNLTRNKIRGGANNKSPHLDVAGAPRCEGSIELVYGVGLFNMFVITYLSTQDVSDVHFVVDHYRCEGKWGKGRILNDISRNRGENQEC